MLSKAIVPRRGQKNHVEYYQAFLSFLVIVLNEEEDETQAPCQRSSLENTVHY